MSKEDLQQIIATANFGSLIGQIENDWFECKGQPYHVDTDTGKRELAKDVSSFTNADGGYILVGVKTKQSTIHFGDEVEELRPFAQSLVNTARYRDIIRSWVRPEIEGINVQWVATVNEGDKGLVIITIPPQKETLKPFLITTTLDDSGRKIEIVFGYAQRKGDVSQPLSVEDLQKILRSGLHYEQQLKEQLDGMEILLKNTVYQNQKESQKKTDGEKIEQRIEQTLAHDELKNKRIILISAYPNQSNQLKTIFLSSGDSIRRRLEHPPILRRHGWSLETLDQAKIMRGEMIRVTNGNRKVIDLYRDGTLVFAGLADHTFLAWHGEEEQRLNPLALIEVIHSFLALYQLVLGDMESTPSEFTLRVDFRNLHLGGVKSFLVPHPVNSSDYLFELDKQDAPDNNGTVIKVFSTKNFDVAAIGFEVAKEMFLWFGIEEDKIPYIKTENDLKMIDTGAIAGQR